MPPQECRAFTVKYHGITNKIITEVHISVPFDPSQPQPPNTQFHKTLALWDTGATHSIITDATAKALSLKSTGKRRVQHGGGLSDHETHVVNFYLPNRVAIAGVIATEHPENDGTFGAIIGMDIIAGGDMSITNFRGETWFTFRWPSFGCIDYVAEINAAKQKAARVGRNDPCPCGSGKKYKKCHGA